ncbi:gamma-glutamyl-gamma-aminobutyrate hydrolase family protein [Lentilactobacillus hilgardii]|uniref:gamma-glutamyl-gamma-aminobutyrate hydrolase family protein n=1 Tax=Lentilactobacillus hilgardii TaxID=1588 RepID=UPI003FA5E6B7
MTVTIGIASNHLIHPTKRWGTNYVNYVQRDFVDGVRWANAVPLIIPLTEPKDAKVYVEKVDGLLLTGGQDVTSLLYGEAPLIQSGETDRYRDEFEIALVKEAVRVHKPVLGICRGQQVINVAFGGSLYQDIQSQLGNSTKHEQYPTSWEIPTHYINTIAHSWLNDLLGDRFAVNSFHHQAIHKLATGLTVIATSDDGIIEGIQSNDGQVIGVQFHPEMMIRSYPTFRKIFAYFAKLVETVE